RFDTAAMTSRLPEDGRRYFASGGGLVEPVTDVVGGLGRQQGFFAMVYQHLLVAHEAALTVRRGRYMTVARELEVEQERLQAELATVAARLEDMKGWQEIETPFGTLPVGLNELTLLFPVLMAAGFMLCSSLFVESLLLRREFHGL